jgi:hypothetical protein
MVFHHVVTIYLFGFSHLTNTIVGGVVLLLHDSSDIFIGFSRIFSETKYSKTCATCFTIALLIFAYTRLIIFPYLIYVSTIKIPVFAVSPYLQPIFGFLMICLFILHIYWYILCLKILGNFFTKGGVTEDLQNKI